MPNPEQTPGESLATSLGVENATPSEQIFIMAGLNRAAAKLLMQRLSDSIPREERVRFDEALSRNDLEGMIEILRNRFPNYDEMQQAAIDEARENVIRRAAVLEKDLAGGGVPTETGTD